MARNSQPKLRLHKARGLAVVTLSDSLTGKRKDYYTGTWGTPESVEGYARLLRIWESSGRRLPDAGDAGADPVCTVGEVLLEFWRWAKSYYTPPEARTFRVLIRLVRDLYASTPARDFTPRRLELVRDAMIERGWSRKSVNRQVSRVRQVFGFGVRRGLVSVETHLALKSVPALRRGKSAAREPKPVRPVPEHAIEATLPHLSEPVAALVRCQLLTGARSGELVIMRPCDIDREGKVWVYRPTDHKTAHHEYERTIYLGPEAQKIVGPLLANRPPDAYVFSPLDAQGRAPVAARRTRYTTTTYHRAVVRACDAGFPAPVELARRRIPSEGRKRKRWETTREWRARIGEEGWKALKTWQQDHRWHPHQLRHNAATRLRKEFGIELARIVLGHRSAGITEVYAEVDQAAALQAMFKLG
jgi:integrase